MPRRETSSQDNSTGGHVGHHKADAQPHHERAEHHGQHPDRYREWRVASHHVDAEPYRRWGPAACLSSHGAYRHGNGVRHALVELEALRRRALTREDVSRHSSCDNL